MARRPRTHGATSAHPSDSREIDAPLSPAVLRELKRRLKDARDPTRYVIVSAFGPRFLLYYDVVDGAYPVNDLSRATHFKRLAEARAVMACLGDGHAVMTVRRTRDGGVKRLTPLRMLFRETERRKKGRRSPA
ncbi:MAG: hypothetical protein ACYDBY_13080 [Thermoanaerobaculia bacterium]